MLVRYSTVHVACLFLLPLLCTSFLSYPIPLPVFLTLPSPFSLSFYSLPPLFFSPFTLCLQERYVQPVVAVKLLLNKEDYNTELTIECRIEGSDLRNNDDRDKFLGRVTFRITVKE